MDKITQPTHVYDGLRRLAVTLLDITMPVDYGFDINDPRHSRAAGGDLDRDLDQARRHILNAMKIVQKATDRLAIPEALDLGEFRIVENVGSTLESMDEDGDILGVSLKLDEACAFDFNKHIDAIIDSEDARATDSKKHQQLNQAQSNKQEYDRRYKEMPRDRIKFKR